MVILMYIHTVHYYKYSTLKRVCRTSNIVFVSFSFLHLISPITFHLDSGRSCVTSNRYRYLGSSEYNLIIGSPGLGFVPWE